jgi:Protein of unknown function (DUF1639)
MGATGWSYFVPYQADVSAALQRLREDVFARGDYVYGDDISDEQVKSFLEKARPEMDPWLQKVREQAEKLSEPMKTLYLQRAEQLKAEIMSGKMPPRKPKRKPKTIQQALDFQAESGTHSILDIGGISEAPKFGHITPFPREKLSEVFGSTTPSHSEIEEAHSFGRLEDFADKWEGIYVIAWRDGSPAEIFFTGHSGD